MISLPELGSVASFVDIFFFCKAFCWFLPEFYSQWLVVHVALVLIRQLEGKWYIVLIVRFLVIS